MIRLIFRYHNPPTSISEGARQGVFSPNGLKYVNVNLDDSEENYIGIYCFDRSTGEFIVSEILFNDYFAVAGGGAISENSRFYIILHMLLFINMI